VCGIAGLWTRDENLEAAEQSLGDMLACIVHRGPDDHGVWADRDAGVVLGHRRLSIIDLSPLGHQPMLADDGRLAVVFNGEIYNFPELRRQLAARGVRFASRSDTEVLLYGYREWGEKVVDHLVGMFAFAIWDARTQEFFLARDRAGEKPLYYATGPWGFAFASEVTALAGLPEVDTEIDPDALALYLHYQYVPAPYSIYCGIRKLPPGHAMRVRGDQVTVWRYWDPAPLAAGPRLRIDDEEAVTELEAILRTAVRGQMLADVPLGAFLSGGIDSTAVVSLMVELSTTPVRTFTIGFDVPRFDESQHASAVARHLGTDHTVEYLTARDALDLIPRLPAMYGEPFADSSALPTHLVSRTARRHVTVALSGDGGDEAFGGYTRYDHFLTALWFSRLAGPFGGIVAPALAHVPGKLGRGAPLLALPPKEIYRYLMSLFSAADVHALTGHAPAFAEFERGWAAAPGRPMRQRAMLTDLLTYLPEAILVKVDRAAMAVSLETRAPLLDHQVLEFALQLPQRLVRSKRLLKELVYRRVPRPLVDREKQGFGVPLAAWFRGTLRPLLEDTLVPARLEAAGIRDHALVRRLIDEHTTGQRDRASQLWPLLVLGLWQDARGVSPRARRRAAPGPAVTT
jgi:asparagine synthase (glutamine-hydrolysing)